MQAASNVQAFPDPAPAYTLVMVTQSELNAIRHILSGDRPSPLVIIGMEGGVCQGASANFKGGLDITVCDYDGSADTLTQPQGGYSTADTFELSPSYDPQWLDGHPVIWSADEKAEAKAEGWGWDGDVYARSGGQFGSDAEAQAWVRMHAAGCALHRKALELSGEA